MDLMRGFFFQRICILGLCINLLMASGCATYISRKMEAANRGFMNQTDLNLVKDGLPSSLLLLDGVNEAFPDNDRLLLAATQLNIAYGSILLLDGEKERATKAFTKAKRYVFRCLSLRNKRFGEAKGGTFDEFIKSLPIFKKADVPFLYYAAQAWTMWIITEDTWASKADAPKVESLLKRILELDETYNYGMAHCLLGSIYTARPPALGGLPEEAKRHFERALEISEGKNLLIPVLYARQYCRLVYDRGLHDRLLEYVIEADVETLPKELMILNILAKEQAKDLLDSSDNYF
ncbi:MAG: hypothetical protein J7L53_06270 [Deltaproteobacteria bacterium]|nr:hypothetical protein [Deltaproteobacteria bacterium]